jgi:hypothetical protein
MVSPEAEVSIPLPQALTSTGKKIADARPVSFFKGGLIALKIDDDDIVDKLGAESSNDDGNALGKSQ